MYKFSLSDITYEIRGQCVIVFLLNEICLLKRRRLFCWVTFIIPARVLTLRLRLKTRWCKMIGRVENIDPLVYGLATQRLENHDPQGIRQFSFAKGFLFTDRFGNRYVGSRAWQELNTTGCPWPNMEKKINRGKMETFKCSQFFFYRDIGVKCSVRVFNENLSSAIILTPFYSIPPCFDNRHSHQFCLASPTLCYVTAGAR